jgi:hypothetical protein
MYEALPQSISNRLLDELLAIRALPTKRARDAALIKFLQDNAIELGIVNLAVNGQEFLIPRKH